MALATGLLAFAAVTAFLYLRSPDPIVLDQAALMSGEETAYLAIYHGYLLDDHQIDYRVVTTLDNEAILDQAVRLYESLHVGSRSDSGRGLLLLINPETDRVRLEVGFSLEGLFPDAFVAYIESRQMVPFFADNRVADGILATTELIIDRIQRSVEIGGIHPDEVWLAGSGGGGAQTAARIGAGNTPDLYRNDPQTVLSTLSPESVLASYFRAMDERNASATLPIYTPQTRALLSARTVTPAQMDSVLRAYRRCTAEPARYNTTGQLAVIRYPANQRECAPWFFRKTGARWQLDLAVLNSAIRFGRSNAWRRSDQGFGDYAFAFTDWSFDSNGFPR